MVRKKGVLMRLEIIQLATNLILENGYSATSPTAISSALNISLGNLTYHFKTKDQILAVLIEMLADFQWKTAQELVNDGETPITALCFELAAMAAKCEESDVARDIYVSAHTNLRSLEIIRKSDKARAKKAFAEFCPDWTDEMFTEAEILVSGIEIATMMTTSDSPSLEVRIAGAMDKILSIYHVPEQRRKMKIDKALSMDFRSYGESLFDDFKKFVFELTEQSFEDWAKNRSNSLLELL